MTLHAQRGYRFATPEQWGACLFDRVDREAFGSQRTIQPIAPYESNAEHYESRGAHAPVVTRAGAMLWRDDAGCLHRLSDCDEAPEVFAAPYALARASRLVSSSSGLWVTGDSGDAVQLHDEETLTRLVVAQVGTPVLDIAADRTGLFVLVERNGILQALRVNRAGQVVGTSTFEGVSRPAAFVYLPKARRFVLLAGEPCPRLYWFCEKGGAPLMSLVPAPGHNCFHASMLGGDGRNRVYVGGSDAETAGARPFVLIFDADGGSLGEIALDACDAQITGLAAARGKLLVTSPRGLLSYSNANVVPQGTPEVTCTLITPLLHSPDREDSRRWLRIEAFADLPEGASLAISYATTADAQIRKRFQSIAADKGLMAGQRVQRLLSEPGVWSKPITFSAGHAHAGEFAAPFSAPLFDVREPHVWVCISLSATAGGALPSLKKLAVLYPGQSLMENLPAIYRRDEAQPGSFLRSLVGVLESTTQELDGRIASLASHVHPLTAEGAWLDFVARWLGLPWDEALEKDQKRRLIARARDIARGRGTRAGLQTLLECLIPGTPARFQVTDDTADHGFATLGGNACPGSTLPALLGGSTPWRGELDLNAVLGFMRLPCTGHVDDGVRHLAGSVHIEIAATAEERRTWEPWLVALVENMVPVTARARVRWVSTLAMGDPLLDGSFELQGVPSPHLGSDAVIGVARLPERPINITPHGADIGVRLQ